MKKQIPNIIKKILLNKEMSSKQVFYHVLESPSLTQGGKTKPRKYDPTYREVVCILSSASHPFIRVNERGEALWTYINEEE